MHVHPALRPPAHMTMLGHVHGYRTRSEVMDANRGPNRPVSHFAETDYCYGTGSLDLRVERVDWNSPIQRDGENWYEVEGVEFTPDGREIGRRQALIRGRRLSALPRNTRS
jgi:hypothetical protein